ncbi:carboxypeptidase M32 [Salinirubrum litoreum]|uniref:Metal-dependent carboxypeptidase n=1 Tax=Salinirubrum litoreum TaxID=1126234 RepID=A0ABD5RGP1_9EURY|nr:carboxypeptidase M32 [Salinirubrum litoreum]
MTGPETTPFERLLDRWERIAALEDARLLLNWDQQVTMPPGGGPARAQQFAAIESAKQSLKAGSTTAELLGAVDTDSLDDAQRAVLREIRREYERDAQVPDALVRELSETKSDAYSAWIEAKEADSFETFAPALRDHVRLQRDRAECIDPTADPYTVLLADGAPYIDAERIDAIFDRLLDELVPLIESIRNADRDLPADTFALDVDESTQMELCEAVLDHLGYDWERGRLDTAPHPFDGLTQYDARITTRFDTDDPTAGLLSAIHEFGHATYNLGLPDDQYGSPLGRARGHAVHESQSRFWENHVARTDAFWEQMLPLLREHVPALEDVSSREASEAVNRVETANPIRVSADELSYHLHIVVRHRTERRLLAGDLRVSEVPAFWNDTFESLLGVRPATDADGCLQDVHWTTSFGMFPNYTLGSVLAAQLAAAMERDLGPIDRLVREGAYDRIHEWLTDRVHRHGQRYETDELIERATGEPLTADYFVEYAREKYADLYRL